MSFDYLGKKQLLDAEKKDLEEAKADIPFELIPTNKIVRPDPNLRDYLEIDGYVYKITRRYSRNRYTIKLKGKKR